MTTLCQITAVSDEKEFLDQLKKDGHAHRLIGGGWVALQVKFPRSIRPLRFGILNRKKDNRTCFESFIIIEFFSQSRCLLTRKQMPDI